MEANKFVFKGVKPDGTFINEAGAIETEGLVRISNTQGGCNVRKCNCSEGHWLSVVLPRTKEGVVEGVTIKFKNKKEMNTVLKYLRQL